MFSEIRIYLVLQIFNSIYEKHQVLTKILIFSDLVSPMLEINYLILQLFIRTLCLCVCVFNYVITNGN